MDLQDPTSIFKEGLETHIEVELHLGECFLFEEVDFSERDSPHFGIVRISVIDVIVELNRNY